MKGIEKKQKLEQCTITIAAKAKGQTVTAAWEPHATAFHSLKLPCSDLGTVPLPSFACVRTPACM